MSRALMDNISSKDNVGGQVANTGSVKRAQGPDLWPFFTMLEQGDTAGQASAELVAGLALARPLVVIPQVEI